MDDDREGKGREILQEYKTKITKISDTLIKRCIITPIILTYLFSHFQAYLSDEDFQDTFHMDKSTFYQLPKWKQDKYKLLADLY